MLMPCDRDVPFDWHWTRQLSDRTVREAIVHPRRRFALYYLREQSGPVEVEELAGQIAAWEHGETGEDPTTEERESVVSSLRRHHVPYLADRDIVSYDRQRDSVVYDTDDSTLAMCLANDPRTTVPWHRVYLALTAISAILLGLVWLDVGPFAALAPIAVAGIVVVVFAAASVVHWYDVYRWRRSTEGEPPDFLVTLGNDVVKRTREEERDEEEGREREEGSREEGRDEGEGWREEGWREEGREEERDESGRDADA